MRIEINFSVRHITIGNHPAIPRLSAEPLSRLNV